MEAMVAGPPDGRAFVFHNGTPSGPVPFAPMIDAAADRGLRTIVCARPGYAGSTPAPGREVVDAADDTAAVLTALGFEEFVTAGWSGGGPHALACAARLAGRCRAAASIAGVAPFGAEGLDWMAGMGEENVAEFGAAVDGEAALTAFLEAAAPELSNVQAGDVTTALGGLVSEVDQAAVTGEFAEHLAAGFRSALSRGIAGWRDDDLAFVRDWGFGLDLATPAAVWQGGQDRMVPFAHGAWLAEHVTGARVNLLPDEGHLSLGVTHFGSILDDLVDLAGF
jgi:pimeloyl-ACP methyl ester carboxylesterase